MIDECASKNRFDRSIKAKPWHHSCYHAIFEQTTASFTMAPPKKRKGFGKGVQAILKGEKLPVIIRENAGKSLFRVELVDPDNGTPTGNFLDNVKTQQMRYPMEKEFPTAKAQSNSSQEEETWEEEPKVTNLPIEKESDRPKPKAKSIASKDDDSLAASLSSGDSNATPKSSSPKRTKKHKKKKTPIKSLMKKLVGGKKKNIPDLVLSDNSDLESEGERDPDGEDEEDLPFKPTTTAEQEGADFYSANDLLIAKGIEDEEKHKNKWAQYLVEKNILLDKKWSVNCKPPKKQSIDVGERVKERHGQKRSGIIVKQDESEEKAKQWTVTWDGDITEPNVPSSRLTIVKDTRVFEWTIVKDHVPEDPVPKYQEHGVVGFDFDKKFEHKVVLEDNPGYDYPFLRLLIHLWAGDWREQLNQLNVHIEDRGGGNTSVLDRASKKMALVSEQEW